MDCLNCDNEKDSHVEYVTPNYSTKELQQMLKARKNSRKREKTVAKHNKKIFKQIEKLKKKLK